MSNLLLSGMLVLCQTPSKRRTNGRTDGQSVRPSVRLLDGVWNERTDGQTPKIIFAASVRPSVCHESQRRRHGVTAAIGGRYCRACLSVRPSVHFKLHLYKRRTDGRTVCPSIRPSVRLLDGVWHFTSNNFFYLLTYLIHDRVVTN